MTRDAMSPAASPTGDPWLLTPGPLTTAPETKAAMLHDFGSRDTHFIDVNRRMRERLLAIVGGEADHVCVPLQGSGTFVVEAMLGTLVPPGGKLLILVILGVALVMAGFSWWFRYNATHRAANFWGHVVAHAIRDAPQVEALIVRRTSKPAEIAAISISGNDYQIIKQT